jgi:hypothetical protein
LATRLLIPGLTESLLASNTAAVNALSLKQLFAPYVLMIKDFQRISQLTLTLL